MSDQEKLYCFGCGEEGQERQPWTQATITNIFLFGKERPICDGARGPKLACITSALKRLWKDSTCPACGDTYQAYNDQERMNLCNPCQFHLDYGREHHGKKEQTTVETQMEALTSMVKAITNYRGLGENRSFGTRVPSWPFSMLETTKGNSAAVLMKAIRQMWKSAVDTAKAEGFIEGSNALVGLKNGTISPVQFDEEIEKNRKNYRQEIEDFKEQCANAVRAAMTKAEGK